MNTPNLAGGTRRGRSPLNIPAEKAARNEKGRGKARLPPNPGVVRLGGSLPPVAYFFVAPWAFLSCLGFFFFLSFRWLLLPLPMVLTS